jgi:phosphatidylserine/phosphatidylglycerophosphate/cardiolipin synthase-like enzyme
MTLKAIRTLPDWDLREMMVALRTGRLCPPYTATAVMRFCPAGSSAEIGSDLEQLRDAGMAPAHIARLLDAVLEDRKVRYEAPADLCELVWTGPEAPGAAERDTAVVVRELLGMAEESIIVVGFVVYQGKEIFKALADSMLVRPGLSVKMFLNVPRGRNDTSLDSEILQRFSANFKAKQWPGSRLPEVYYYPRALDVNQTKRASLHAKCIIVDKRIAFISSANLTEAAQVRNIEAGVLVRSPALACQLAHNFEALIESGQLKSLLGHI